MQQLVILGATGSIGTQALDVVRRHPELCQVLALSGYRNVTRLAQQIKEFSPRIVVVPDGYTAEKLKELLGNTTPCEIWVGEQALCEIASLSEADIILSSLVGAAGVWPTWYAAKAGKSIALANKESLVVAGAPITKTVHENGGKLLPVDSEHSAIYQCLQGEHSEIEKILLTASGGPFLRHSIAEMACITPREALTHPTWSMGKKVSIDSATLTNKGLEMIEAHWLFGVTPTQIEMVVHPESTIHSMVQFVDGVIMAQLGIADMRLPISYALGLGARVGNSYARLDFSRALTLHFEAPDFTRFPSPKLAYQAIEIGGTAPAIFNAANEMAVAAFLDGRIPFCQIALWQEMALDKFAGGSLPDSPHEAVELLMHVDRQVREAVTHFI